MSGVKTGYEILEVLVESIDGTKALVRDSFGRAKTVRADVRRGNGPAPRVGEHWLIDRTLGVWTFASCVNSLPPTVTGDSTGVTAVNILMATLESMGLIVNGTTSTPPIPVAALTVQTGVEVGAVIAWPHTVIPAAFLVCNGQNVSRLMYPDLFAIIGTSYGIGDGSTTFTLPDYRGRTLVEVDASQAEFATLGQTGGEKNHTLTLAESPVHTHIQDPHNHLQDAHSHALTSGIVTPSPIPNGTQSPVPSGATYGFNYQTAPGANALSTATATNQAATATNQNAGAGGAHNNLQPYATAQWIMKALITSMATDISAAVAAASASASAAAASAASAAAIAAGVTATRMPGEVVMFAGASTPAGWLLCDGSPVSRTTYASLFSAIGTQFGVGDGSTTFNLPDNRGRVAAGVTPSQAEFATLGQTGGEKNHTLTEAEIEHKHELPIGKASSDGGGAAYFPHNDPSYGMGAPSSQTWANYDNSGAAVGSAITITPHLSSIPTNLSVGAHNNLQPYVSFNFIIKT